MKRQMKTNAIPSLLSEGPLLFCMELLECIYKSISTRPTLMSQSRKMVRTNKKKEEVPGIGLLDQVFSWSISDILNQNQVRSSHSSKASSIVFVLF